MVTVTLDDRDREILDRLGRGAADVETLAASAPADPAYLRERLPELADNGLVRRVDDGYAITDSGERAMAGSPTGRMDDRIDTPPAVEDAIESFDLRADREDAVRSAFAVLAYWGSATESEIVDAVYSEAPAGFDSRESWWAECVRDPLARLPRVDAPAERSDSAAVSVDCWAFEGAPAVDQAGGDGRSAAGDDVLSDSSVRAAVAGSDIDDAERSAVRAAFAFLFREGEATADEIRDWAYPDHDAGYDSAVDWWADCVRPALDRLPGVEQSADSPESWAYRQ